MIEPVEECLRRGDWAAALSQCQVMLVEHPTHPKLQAYAGLCLFRQGDFADAATHLRRALDLDASYVDAGMMLLRALDKLGRYREAYERARDLQIEDPNNNRIIGMIEHLKNFDVEEHDGWERTIRLDCQNTLVANEG